MKTLDPTTESGESALTGERSLLVSKAARSRDPSIMLLVCRKEGGCVWSWRTVNRPPNNSARKDAKKGNGLTDN